MWLPLLTSWPGHDVQPRDTSWDIFVVNIKKICQIGTEPLSRHNKKLHITCVTLNFAFLTVKTCMPQAFYAMNVWCEFNGDWVTETWWKSCDKQTDRQMGRQTKADTELLTVSKNGWRDLAEPGSTFSDRIWNSIKCFRIYCEHCKEKLQRMIKTVYSYILNHCNDSRSSEIPNYQSCSAVKVCNFWTSKSMVLG